MKIANKSIVYILLTCLFISCSKEEKGSVVISQPTSNIFLADPTIFKDNGIYYLYGTSQGSLTNMGNGFLVYTSTDLQEWEGPIGNTGGFALKDTNAFGDTGFWAPQIFKHNNIFYMAYTANEKTAMATSNSPLGPFANSGSPISETSQIDPFVFTDDDGKSYLYHVRLTNGNRIFVAEMNDDLQTIKEETLTEIITATEPWENTVNASWPVAEGPTVLKLDGTYYLFYSANDFRNPDYAVGYATALNPMGPWTKASNNPIIHDSMIDENGTGHGDVFYDGQGNMQYVIHTHFSASVVHPRKTGVIQLQKNGEIITSLPETFEFLKQTTN
ncbi:MAG: glycoside hydrolase family 43 protein [Aestuariibaculum sp.]